jgi:hypothetical protein
MKRLVFLVSFLVAFGGAAFSLNIFSFPPPLNGGGNVIVDAGAGLTAFGDNYDTMSVPPLFVNMEYAFSGILPISVGGFATFFQYNSIDKSSEEEWQYSFFTIGGKANWHWGFDVKWMDLYTGMWIGYKSFYQAKLPDSYYDAPNTGTFDYGWQVGVRFYLLKNVGIVVESGYPFVLKVGTSLKFKG